MRAVHATGFHQNRVPLLLAHYLTAKLAVFQFERERERAIKSRQKYTVTKERVALILVLIARGAVRSIFKKEQGLCIIEHGINSLQIITTKDRKKIRRKKYTFAD